MLEEIIAHGNRGHVGFSGEAKITCADGFTLSVIAGGGTYCHPRPVLCYHSADHDMVHEPFAPYEDVAHDYEGPYDQVEVGFPSERPEPWEEWRQFAEESEKPTETVYGYVPVGMVRVLVANHGGEREEGALVL
jgi:hypothetical protein